MKGQKMLWLLNLFMNLRMLISVEQILLHIH